MPVSLSGFEKRSPGEAAGSIDKSKFDLFKPLSLDVIFHDCKIAVTT
jgi:hypothetical protein